MSRTALLTGDGPHLVAILEALIFAADSPISAEEMTRVLDGVDGDRLAEALDELTRQLEHPGRGLSLEQVAGGYRITTSKEVGEWVRRMYRFRNRRRLSPAALETLAIIAYRQPITGPEIQQLRGVDPQGTLGGLLGRRLIRILGRKKVVGRPLLYGTTRDFLMHFGLNTLEDLPSLDAFGDLFGPAEHDRLRQAGPATPPDQVEGLEIDEADLTPGAEQTGLEEAAEERPECVELETPNPG